MRFVVLCILMLFPLLDVVITARFARLSGKFPDYCDIGLDVFYDIYDWHVRQGQQINITRMSDQRIAILFMFTQLILRWENETTYVGTPY